MTRPEKFESRRAKRVRRIVLRAMGRYVFVPWLVLNGLWMLAVVAVGRALLPKLDPNGWPFLLRMLPVWIALIWLTVYVLWAIEIRAVLRRKGPRRAVRYLFPEALAGTEGCVDRVCFRLLGLRTVIRQARSGRSES